MNPVINRDGDEQINFDPQRRNARDPVSSHLLMQLNTACSFLILVFIYVILSTLVSIFTGGNACYERMQ